MKKKSKLWLLLVIIVGMIWLIISALGNLLVMGGVGCGEDRFDYIFLIVKCMPPPFNPGEHVCERWNLNPEQYEVCVNECNLEDSNSFECIEKYCPINDCFLKRPKNSCEKDPTDSENCVCDEWEIGINELYCAEAYEWLEDNPDDRAYGTIKRILDDHICKIHEWDTCISAHRKKGGKE